MNMFFAATDSHEKRDGGFCKLVNKRLWSFATTSEKLFDHYRENIKTSETKMIIDSGAFSTWNKGEKIDLEAYIAFCKKHEDIIDYVVNLDVIPGAPGKKNTNVDIKVAAKQGWTNYQQMKKEISADKIIHVFHQGEDLKWLRRMASSMPYIGLSPANDKTTEQRVKWLDKCMKYVLDENGVPIVKFHGFAATSTRIITRYPWFSVDSASWKRTAAYGKIFIPQVKNNVPDFSISQEGILLSEHKNSINDPSNFRKKPLLVQQKIRKYVEEKGADLENLIKDYYARAEFNISFYQDVEKSRPTWPWAMKQQKKGLNI